MGAVDLTALPVTRARRVMSAQDATELCGVDAVQHIEPDVTSAGLWLDEASGEPVLAYYPMPADAVGALRAAVLQVKYSETMRARTGVRNRSAVFGMAPRRPTMQRESCRASRMAVEQPDVHSVIVALADRLARDLQVFAPEQAARDAEVVGEQVAPEWRMTEQALWTSGIINSSSTLPYHRDGLNFEAWSAMPVLRRGMRGGHLHLPEYDLTVGCRDGWVVYFPGWQLVHGVTPLRPTTDDGYRYSVVYYSLRGMKSCFEHAVELGEARRRRTLREEGIAQGGAIPQVRRGPRT